MVYPFYSMGILGTLTAFSFGRCFFSADCREVDLRTHDTSQIASTNSGSITSLTSSISFELWNEMDILPFIHHMSYHFMSFGQLSSIFQVTD